MAVRCQDEIGHLLIGAQFPTRPADSCKLIFRRTADGHDLDSRHAAQPLPFEKYGSGRRLVRATIESLVTPAPARPPDS